jgi:hypothetical protein
MATKDLITLDRAKLNIASITDNTQDGLLQALLTAASDAIQKYTRRDFIQTTYDELYSGNGQRQMLLRQYPLAAVQSVRYRPVTVLKITNTDPTNVQARVQVTNIGLSLIAVKNGVKTTNTAVTFAGNPTLTACGVAINALAAQGWQAQVIGDAINYGSWPSADVYWPPAFPTFNAGTTGQGALQCVAGSFAELKMHTYELAGYQWDARGWLLRAIPYTDPELLHPEDLVWPTGINNLRIQYTAGYSTIPEAVQEACAEWTAALYFQTSRDPMLTNQLLTTGAAAGWKGAPGEPPDSVVALLKPYRRHTIATDQS